MTRFRAQLLLATNISSRHRAALAVRQLHDAAPQRHACAGRQSAATVGRQDVGAEREGRGAFLPVFGPIRRAGRNVSRRKPGDVRSEEHTSELQSLTNLVCRLLLEKKKKLD